MSSPASIGKHPVHPILVAFPSGWLGGEMVYVKGMAVEAVDELVKKEKKQQAASRHDQPIRRAG